MEDLTGVVLAGGHSTRMGQDKALVLLRGKTLLEWVLDAMGQVCQHLLVVTSPERLPHHRASSAQARLVADETPDRGPLGGLYTGLRQAATNSVLLTGCDTPFLQPALLRLVAEAGAGKDASVPRLDGIPQTLQAAYSRQCLPSIESLLQRKRPGLRDMLPLVDAAYVERDELVTADPRLLSFFNVNTETDLSRAEGLLRDGIL